MSHGNDKKSLSPESLSPGKFISLPNHLADLKTLSLSLSKPSLSSSRMSLDNDKKSNSAWSREDEEKLLEHGKAYPRGMKSVSESLGGRHSERECRERYEALTTGKKSSGGEYFIKLDSWEKERKLRDIMSALDFNQVYISVRTLETAKRVHDLMVKWSFPSTLVVSEMCVTERLTNSRSFKEGLKRVLITNVIGREEIEGRVNLIIMFDPPKCPDEYFRLVGRNGRKKVAITMVSAATQLKNIGLHHLSELPQVIQASEYM